LVSPVSSSVTLSTTHIDGGAEVEAGVTLVDDLEVLPLYEGTHLWLPGQNIGNQLPANLLLVVVLKIVS
jgi:hypothetical protein